MLPDRDTSHTAEHVDIAVLTGLGDARNVVNVLSSHVVVACRGSVGTLSEIAHALNADRPVVALDFPLGDTFAEYERTGRLVHAATPKEAVERVERFLEDET